MPWNCGDDGYDRAESRLKYDLSLPGNEALIDPVEHPNAKELLQAWPDVLYEYRRHRDETHLQTTDTPGTPTARTPPSPPPAAMAAQRAGRSGQTAQPMGTASSRRLGASRAMVGRCLVLR
ncbi:hypothetical protein GCM10010327_41620 [Streptomyces nitrosporeus]|nr:hypothetical protein GCM10010327_41620 [Streptomyces nitrosporeus]